MADAYDFCYFGGFIFNEMSVFALSSVVNANFLSFLFLGFTAALFLERIANRTHCIIQCLARQRWRG
jgi:hypothetical protein